MYIHLSSVDPLAVEFRARGAQVLDGPEDRVYDQREPVVVDCNNLVICFAQDCDPGNEAHPPRRA